DQLISAAGTLVNLLVGGVVLAVLARSRSNAARPCFFFCLFAFVNLFQGAGYFLFSGIAGIGDWASVVDGWTPAWLWRIIMAATGGLAYFFVMLHAMRWLSPFVGSRNPGRYRRAIALSIVPYLTGSTLFIGVLPARLPESVCLIG